MLVPAEGSGTGSHPTEVKQRTSHSIKDSYATTLTYGEVGWDAKGRWHAGGKGHE